MWHWRSPVQTNWPLLKIKRGLYIYRYVISKYYLEIIFGKDKIFFSKCVSVNFLSIFIFLSDSILSILASCFQFGFSFLHSIMFLDIFGLFFFPPKYLNREYSKNINNPHIDHFENINSTNFDLFSSPEI